jgi:hypothetical protein
MRTEDRLRQTLNEQAADVDVTPPPWAVVRGRARRSSMRRRAAVGVAGVLALAVGGMTVAGFNSGATRRVTTPPGGEATASRPSPTTSGPAASAPATPPAPSFGSTAPASVPPSGHAQLTSVDVAHHDGFDRVVFRFGSTGTGLPGYSIGFARGPLYHDASGAPVALEGSVAIVVKMVYATGGGTYHGPTTITPGLPSVLQLTQTGDFEGYLIWAIGLRAQAPFRVSALGGPDRIVIDIATP